MTLPAEHRVTPAGQPRARALGLPFAGRPGRWNAITDVPGVQVGYVTLIQGDHVRTGVTAIHPRGPSGTGDPVAAGFHSQNGNGEMTGVSWINESGTFTGPVAITNTHAVGVAHAGIVAWTVRHYPEVAEMWLLPVAAETWDGYLNDINGHHVTEDTVIAALSAASSGPVEEGSVGGGTGMNCYQFKGGSGTASRLVSFAGASTRSGCSSRPTSAIATSSRWPGSRSARTWPPTTRWPSAHSERLPRRAPDRSSQWWPPMPRCSPTSARRFARRVTSGLARTGTSGSHFSGDLFLAFSTANPGAFRPDSGTLQRLDFVPWEHLDPFFEAVVQATEEAVVNALVANDDMTGRDGHRTPALPRDRVVELLSRAGRLPA